MTAFYIAQSQGKDGLRVREDNGGRRKGYDDYNEPECWPGVGNENLCAGKFSKNKSRHSKAMYIFYLI